MARILIIDDTPENLLILSESLKNDYNINIANSAEEAVRLIDKGIPFDLILSDVMMPNITGYEFIDMINKREDCANIPVIFITALTEDKDEFRGLSLGAADYITKPINIPLLKARLKNHISYKLLRDNLEEQIRDRTEQVVYSEQVLIEGLGTLAEFRDPETGEHIKRTQLYVVEVADYLRKHNPKYKNVIDENMVAAIYRAAPLHDIGKVGISDSILLKPGPLTKKEFAIMKQHTTFGYNTLKKIYANNPTNKMIEAGIEMAKYHHENWDGTGYPEGLSGEDIPLSARIMAISDVYDALRTNRPYKEAFSHKKCVDIILNGDKITSPEHFDPDILEAFKALENKFNKISIEYSD